jgi:hypothetical protein
MIHQRFEVAHGGAQNWPRRQDYRSLNKILQFPNVPRPRVALENVHYVFRDDTDVLVALCGELSNEMPNERWNVLVSVSQGWKGNRKDVNPVKKVFTEPAFHDHLSQIEAGGRDNPDVHPNSARSP